MSANTISWPLSCPRTPETLGKEGRPAGNVGGKGKQHYKRLDAQLWRHCCNSPPKSLQVIIYWFCLVSPFCFCLIIIIIIVINIRTNVTVIVIIIYFFRLSLIGFYFFYFHSLSFFYAVFNLFFISSPSFLTSFLPPFLRPVIFLLSLSLPSPSLISVYFQHHKGGTKRGG